MASLGWTSVKESTADGGIEGVKEVLCCCEYRVELKPVVDGREGKK